MRVKSLNELTLHSQRPVQLFLAASVLHQMKYRYFSLHWLLRHHTMLRLALAVKQPLLLLLFFALFHVDITYLVSSVINEGFLCCCSLWLAS